MMDKTEYKDIWIYAETDADSIKPAFYELISKASELCNGKSDVCALMIGEPSQSILDEVCSSGVDKVYIAEHEKLSVYNPDFYITAMAFMASEYKPEAVWVASTSIGAETAPGAACRLRTGMVAHGVDAYYSEDGELVVSVPAFGGKYINEELTPFSRPVFASFKNGVFDRKQLDGKDAVIIRCHADPLDSMESRISLRQMVEHSQESVPVDKAEFIICAGLGASDEESYQKVRTLAEKCNAVQGYTRPVIDVGRENDEARMIGTSGKSVHPKVYLGFGVSGASHHMFGIKDSGVIIAVNNDPKAEIFKSSDIKIVQDCGPVLDALLQML